MQTRTKADQAERFARVLEREFTELSRSNIEPVITLEDAAENLFYKASHSGRALRRAMREIEERTRGCDFRFDTRFGPIFAASALCRFAGYQPDHGWENITGPVPSWQAVA